MQAQIKDETVTVPKGFVQGVASVIQICLRRGAFLPDDLAAITYINRVATDALKEKEPENKVTAPTSVPQVTQAPKSE